MAVHVQLAIVQLAMQRTVMYLCAAAEAAAAVAEVQTAALAWPMALFAVAV